jgi:hypothetical protein
MKMKKRPLSERWHWGRYIDGGEGKGSTVLTEDYKRLFSVSILLPSHTNTHVYEQKELASQSWNEKSSQIFPSFPLNHPSRSIKAIHSPSSIEIPDRKEKKKPHNKHNLTEHPYPPIPPFPSALYNTLPTNLQAFPKCETHNKNNNNSHINPSYRYPLA